MAPQRELEERVFRTVHIIHLVRVFYLTPGCVFGRCMFCGLPFGPSSHDYVSEVVGRDSAQRYLITTYYTNCLQHINMNLLGVWWIHIIVSAKILSIIQGKRDFHLVPYSQPFL